MTTTPTTSGTATTSSTRTAPITKNAGNKINLGCGQHRYDDYINVDRSIHAKPDVIHDFADLDVPFPWPVDSCTDIRAWHILEHLELPVFYHFLKNCYRMLHPEGILDIKIPNVKHDVFWGDIEHVRPVTPDALAMFSQQHWRDMIEERDAWITPYWREHKVDFEIVPPVMSQIGQGIPQDDPNLTQRAHYQWNVIQEFRIRLKAKKPFFDKGDPQFQGEGYMRPEKRAALERIKHEQNTQADPDAARRDSVKRTRPKLERPDETV